MSKIERLLVSSHAASWECLMMARDFWTCTILALYTNHSYHPLPWPITCILAIPSLCLHSCKLLKNHPVGTCQKWVPVGQCKVHFVYLPWQSARWCDQDGGSAAFCGRFNRTCQSWLGLPTTCSGTNNPPLAIRSQCNERHFFLALGAIATDDTLEMMMMRWRWWGGDDDMTMRRWQHDDYMMYHTYVSLSYVSGKRTKINRFHI